MSARPKCLRCGAGPEWIQGKVSAEAKSELSPARGSVATAIMQRVEGTSLIHYEVDVRVLAVAEGYAMVRRKGCAPFVLEMSRVKMPQNR